MKTGFDRVEVPAMGTLPARTLTERQFEQLPLDQRVRAILGGQLRFFRGTEQIPMRDALGK